MEACQKVRPYDLAVALRLIGAGVGRTGTHSLKQALEELLGGPCYHMSEVYAINTNDTQLSDAVLAFVKAK